MLAAQIGSMTTGHGCWPPTTICQGTPTVIVENKPAAFIGAAAIPHRCVSKPYPAHPTAVAQGSATVIVENKPGARIGDMMVCTDMIAVGCATVVKGG